MQFMIGAKVAMNVVTIVIIHPARKILPIYTICRFLFFIPPGLFRVLDPCNIIVKHGKNGIRIYSRFISRPFTYVSFSR